MERKHEKQPIPLFLDNHLLFFMGRINGLQCHPYCNGNSTIRNGRCRHCSHSYNGTNRYTCSCRYGRSTHQYTSPQPYAVCYPITLANTYARRSFCRLQTDLKHRQ